MDLNSGMKRRAYRIGERPKDKKEDKGLLMGTLKPMQKQIKVGHICSMELVRDKRTKDKIMRLNPHFRTCSPVWLCECGEVSQSM